MKDYYDLGTRHVVSAAYPYANHQLVGIVAPDDDTVVSMAIDHRQKISGLLITVSFNETLSLYFQTEALEVVPWEKKESLNFS